MSVISDFIDIRTDITDMKYNEVPLMSGSRLAEAEEIGFKLARLRVARKMRQVDAAARAGIARSTAALLEKGDAGRTVAQVLRYLQAIAPDVTLLALIQQTDPSLKVLAQTETRQRVRKLSAAELAKLDF